MAKVNKNELRVGLFILIPVLIVAMLVLVKLGYSLAGSTYDLYLKTDSLVSVKKGTAVKLKGYNVGRVINISPVYEPDLHFITTIRITGDVKVYKNTIAVIMNQNIIGDAVIELKTPEIKNETLDHGDVIERVQYVNLDRLVQDVQILLSSLTGTVNVVREISIENKDDIGILIGNLSESSESLNAIIVGSESDIIDIISSLKSTAATTDEIAKEFQKKPFRFLFRGDPDKK